MIRNEDDKANLYYIQDTIQEIQSYVGKKSYQDFTQDELVVGEAIKLMNNIGSAARMLSDAFKENYTSVDWKTLVNLEYITYTGEFETNLAPIWAIIKNDLPEIEEKILWVTKRMEGQAE